ncbi:MAG: hypothetical protein AAF849_03130 [Bacteroidota bacterium]
MKKIRLLVLAFLPCIFCLAQTNADILISIDKEALRLVERKPNTPFLQNMERRLFDLVGANADLVRKIYETPQAVGIASENELLAFVEVVDEALHIGVQFSLADATLFEASVQQYGIDNLKNIKPIDESIESETIKAALLAQRADLIEKRKALFEVHTLENGVRYLDQNDYILAWTDTDAFVLKTNLLNSQNELANYSGTDAEYYAARKTIIYNAQRSYLSQLRPITWQNMSHDVFAIIHQEGASLLNASEEATGRGAPLHLLFDQAVVLEETDYQLQIDFLSDQIDVQLLQGEVSVQQKSWTKAELTRNHPDINWTTLEDSLAVWFKVLGERFR